MKKNKIVSYFLILLIISCSQTVYSLDEKNNKTEYIDWLNKNREGAHYIEYLFKLISMEEDFNKALGYLNEYGIYVTKQQDKALIEKRKGDFFYLLGNLADAQRAYQEAWENYKDPSNEESLYLSSVTLAELGDIGKAKSQIDYILQNNFSDKIKGKCIFLSAVISLYENHIDSAVLKLKQLLKTGNESILPDTIYLLYQASMMKGEESEKIKYYNILKTDYGKSLAYNLISKADKFTLSPEPLSLLLFSKIDERFFIQTGSFSIKENAIYLKKDLSNFNFNVEIERGEKNNNDFYRVLIGPFKTIKEAKIKLKELKEKGFDGFIIKH